MAKLMKPRWIVSLALVFVASTAAAAPIPLDAAQARRIGLTVVAAQPAAATPIATLPGTVTPPPGGRVAVSAPFAGVVRQSLVIEGQTVTRGQRLAVVQSREVLQTGAELARARARLGVARQASDRAAKLVAEGLVAGARAEEAAAALREVEVEVNEKARILRLANADPTNGTYTLVAPIAGRLTEATAQTGSALGGADAPFVIDAPGPFHVVAQLPARLLGAVRPGMAVRIGSGAAGRVLAVGSVIDPATRSATLRASIPANAEVAAGSSVNLVVLSDPAAGAVSVPAAAVVRIGAQTVVFEQTAQGFVARPVRVLGGAGGQSVVSGLTAGVRVAATGTAELKSLAGAR
jgi:cobalt-zinc-cadmium efflux system membrane fusion protein